MNIQEYRVCCLQKEQDEFASKTDTGSADLYFHYYGMLMHQQNMLQDQIRTGTYYAAILENTADFQGKTIMDVGAGSGILSLFAAQVTSTVDQRSCRDPYVACQAGLSLLAMHVFPLPCAVFHDQCAEPSFCDSDQKLLSY